MKTSIRFNIYFLILLILASCTKEEELGKIDKLNYEINCVDDSTYFYYTNDYEKIYLELSTICITIKFTEKVNQNFFNYLIEKNIGLDSITYIVEDNNLAFGWLTSNFTCEETKILLLNLAKESKVSCVNANFTLLDDNDINSKNNNLDSIVGLTDEFIVKLKSSTPSSYLNSLVSETKTRIIKVTDLYYLISADKYSTQNSLELSRLFYETDKFEYSHPNFIMNAIPFGQNYTEK